MPLFRERYAWESEEDYARAMAAESGQLPPPPSPFLNPPMSMAGFPGGPQALPGNLPRPSIRQEWEALRPSIMEAGRAMIPAPRRPGLGRSIGAALAQPLDMRNVQGGWGSLARGLRTGLAGSLGLREQYREEMRELPSRQMEAGLRLEDWFEKRRSREVEEERLRQQQVRQDILDRQQAEYRKAQMAEIESQIKAREEPPKPTTRTVMQKDLTTGETFAVTYDPTDIDPQTNQARIISKIRAEPTLPERISTPEQRQEAYNLSIKERKLRIERGKQIQALQKERASGKLTPAQLASHAATILDDVQREFENSYQREMRAMLLGMTPQPPHASLDEAAQALGLSYSDWKEWQEIYRGKRPEATTQGVPTTTTESIPGFREGL